MKYKASVLLFCILIHTCVILDAAVSKDAVSSSSAPQVAGSRAVAKEETNVKAAVAENPQAKIDRLELQLKAVQSELRTVQSKMAWLLKKYPQAECAYSAHLASLVQVPNPKSKAELEIEREKAEYQQHMKDIETKIRNAVYHVNPSEEDIVITVHYDFVKKITILVYPSDKAATISQRLFARLYDRYRQFFKYQGQDVDLDKTIDENGIKSNSVVYAVNT